MMLFFKVFLFAFLSSLIITPLIRKIALIIGATDKPEERKIHKKEMPRLGGMAIFISFYLTSVFIFNHLDNHIKGLFIGASIIFLCGIIDDIKSLSYKTKLVFQFIATILLITNGVYISNISFLSNTIHLGIIGIPLTFIWVIGITNAVNLLDGIDGLACGVSAIASFFLAIIAYINGNIPIAILMTIIVGSCFGFLPFNFKNAKIFMGDSGSLFLGFILAAISMQGTFKSATTFIIVPALLLGLPIYDTINIIIRRIIKGTPITMPDKEHFHHRLLALGLNQTQTTIIGYTITTILGFTALLLTLNLKITAISIIIISIVILGGIILENILYFKYKQSNNHEKGDFKNE